MKKRKVKNTLIFLIISISIFLGIGVYAAITFPSSDVLYDASKSELEATNVKDAIDELYNKCSNSATSSGPTIGDTILDKVEVVTEGDGLYKDENEDRYFYRGKNPNNYITFNDEKAGWRIISVESDGTLKIIKTDGLGYIEYNDSAFYNNSWIDPIPSTINEYLNGYYPGSSFATSGTSTIDPYFYKLNKTAKRQIISHNFSIGGINLQSRYLNSQINQENAKKWNGLIALPTASEFLRANSNQTRCGTDYDNTNNYSTCKNTNWMIYSNGDSWWLLSPNASVSNHALNVDGINGTINSEDVEHTNEVRPTLYIFSSVKITGGNGTQNNPYTLG